MKQDKKQQYINPMWKGGISFNPYPKEWIKTLKQSILKRDDNKCIFCHDNKNLAIHHIDYNKKNCSPENLITLCKSCHGKTNTNRSYYRFLFELKKTREYFLTTSQLIDRLDIVTLKSIKLNNKEEYKKESDMIINDLNLIKDIDNIKKELGNFILAVQVNAIANLLIWENEASVRNGELNMTKEEIANKLQLTHALNRVRNQAMNVISNITGERKDLKLDCLAAELCKTQGYDFGGIFE